MTHFRENLKWQNFAALTVAGIINAIGVVMFLSPVGLYDSGISGTSMLMSALTPLGLSLFLIALNFPLFIYGYKRQGSAFTVYSLYAVVDYSLAAWVITDVLPIDVSSASPIAGSDLLLCAIFGGIISGVGSGMTIRFGGAIDGIEVMAVIFAKKIGVSVGTFVMSYNVVLYVICGIITRSWILPLYSIVTYMAALKTVDFIVEGLDRSKSAMIITEKPDELSAALMAAFECGLTRIAARGGYMNTDRTVIYFVVNRFQIAKMKSVIHAVDPRAYFTVSEVAEVFKSAGGSATAVAKADEEPVDPPSAVTETVDTEEEFEFLDTDFLRNDELTLTLEKIVPANPAKQWVPAYHFSICSPEGYKMGKIDLRIGYHDKLFYGGHIGYGIDEPYRGHRYAAKACLMLFELARKHGMEYLYITCEPKNAASYRTCELAGGQLLGVYELPEDNDMRIEDGKTEVCVFKFEL